MPVLYHKRYTRIKQHLICKGRRQKAVDGEAFDNVRYESPDADT